MSRINHILRELGRNLYRFPFTALGALLSLSLLYLLFDLFWIGAATTELMYTRLLSELRMEAFIVEEVIEADIPKLQDNIAHIEGVVAIEYISKDRAREKLWDMLGTDLLVGYDSLNPLPRSFVLEFETEVLNSTDLAAIKTALSERTEITEVSYSIQWLENTEITRTIIRQAGLALGILILLTAILSSVNNIRLMTRARAVGFQQMRLLGAGKTFLAFPFLLEGLLVSGLSAVVGWMAISYGRQMISLTQVEIVYPTLDEMAIFCVAAGLLGIASGYLGVRRLLK